MPCIAATKYANNAPTATPKTTVQPTERTLLAKKPISAPTISPLTVDPMTIPTIAGRVSGADSLAESPVEYPQHAAEHHGE